MNSERRKRLAKICEQLEEIQVEIQAIADEEQECYDNLPESLQYAELGIDGWDRPVYQDPNGLLWKDTTLGSDTPSFASACNNEFEGEPDMPIEMTYPDFE